MKKILFNLSCTQPSQDDKRHGGGKYGEVVFRHILEKGYPIAVAIDGKKWLNPEMQKLIDCYHIPCYDTTLMGFKDMMNQSGCDRFYTPILSDGMDYEGETIATIHGTRPMELQFDSMMLKYNSTSMRDKVKFFIKFFFPKFGYRHAYSIYRNALLDENFKFVMVSNHSVCSLHSYLPKESLNCDIPVFYSPSTSSTKEMQTKFTDKYYLLVSANRWEKNALRAIIGFDRLFSVGYLQGVKVRITGVKAATAYKYKLHNPDRFEFMGYVDDDELEHLYHDAYAFVYPSLNEGFGYPPMEAMRYGTPALVSPHTSISEVCEGAVLYFNPFSIEEIMARILYMERSEIHEKYSRLATEQFAKITAKQKEDLDAFVEYLYKK